MMISSQNEMASDCCGVNLDEHAPGLVGVERKRKGETQRERERERERD